MTSSSGPRLRPGMFARQQSQIPKFGTNSAAGNYAVAFLQGLQDDATFGLGDQAYSLAGALWNKAHGGTFDYSRRISYEHERDRWYADHYGKTRTGGKLVGTALQILAGAPVEATAKLGSRIPQATALLKREAGTIAAAAGASGAGSQWLADKATGHKSSIGDYVGAGLGGIAETPLLLISKPGAAGAVNGAVSSFAQDLLNGRAPSLGRAADAASLGTAVGGSVGQVARTVSNAASRAAKEQLGEWGSWLRTLSRWDTTATTRKTAHLLPSKRRTFPDQRTNSGQLVESKFGLRARLSPNQLEAFYQPNLNYRVDHVLPRDIAAAVGMPTGQISDGLFKIYGSPPKRAEHPRQSIRR